MESVTTQGIIVALVTLLACAYLGHRSWKKWSGASCEKGCGPGCATPSVPTLVSTDELTRRVRQRS